MRTAAAILGLLTFCSLSHAQTKPDVQLPANVRMYEPKNLTPDHAHLVAIFVRNLLNFPGLYLNWEDVPHAFVIRSGNPQELDTAETLLKRYDVPEPTVELTVYLIRAATSPPRPPDPRLSPAPSPTPVPAELKAAIDEMKGAFNYDGYSLWDTIVLQPNSSSGAETRGILPADSGARPYVYTETVRRGAATESKTVNLASFQFSIKMPQSKEDIDSHISIEDVTIREGQKLVLGKIRLLPTANADLFLVLTAKVH